MGNHRSLSSTVIEVIDKKKNSFFFVYINLILLLSRTKNVKINSLWVLAFPFQHGIGLYLVGNDIWVHTIKEMGAHSIKISAVG